MRFHGGDRLEISNKYGYDQSEIIDFSSSVNPFGPPASVIKKLKKNLGEIAFYPDSNCAILKQKLAEHLNISWKNIIFGNGSVELIFDVINYCKPKKVLIPSPTFCEYEIAVKNSGGEVVDFKLDKKNNFNLDVDKFLEIIPSVNMIIINNPNNPTASLISKNDLLKIIDKAKKYNVDVLIDEVFMDFIDNKQKYSLLKEAACINNLIVLNSFTKLYSLAGIRIGYIVSNKNMIKLLSLKKHPWNVNSLAQIASVTALEDKLFLEKSLRLLNKNKEYLLKELSRIKEIKIYPSETNYFLVEIVNHSLNSSELKNELAKEKILIRDCKSFKYLNNKFFRVAVKSEEENKILIRNLRRVLTN
ncbi:MAG: threonine-phosphate decarboxylase [Actinobacteria bacterium]|nr:threonine-phosphate decarboxylase [Actinomycetota bacterium]